MRSHAMLKFSRLADFLVGPSAKIKTPVGQRSAQVLATVLSFVCFALFALSVLVFGKPEYFDSASLRGVQRNVNLAILDVLLAYFLSRTRFYRIGGITVVGGGLYLIIVSVLANPTLNAVGGTLDWLVVDLAIAAMVLSSVETISIFVLTIAAHLYLASVMPLEVRSLIYNSLIFYSTISGFMVTTVWARKKSEAAREQSEGRYQNLIEIAVEGTMEIDDKSKIILANRPVLEMLGYSHDELIGMHLHDLIYREDLEKLKSKQNERKNGKKEAYEIRMVRKNGEVFWMSTSVSPIYNSDGKVTGAFGILIDVTAKRTADDLLRKSEARFRSVFENAAVGIKVVDSDLRIVNCNSAFCDLLGYSSEELASKHLWDLILPEDHEIARQTSELLRTRRKPFSQIEVRFLRKDNEPIWVRITISLVRDSLGTALETISIVEDISGRKEAENQVAEQQLRLMSGSKMSALGEMAGGIAHEINSPLTVIMMKAGQLKDLIEMGSVEPKTVIQVAEKIESTVSRVSKIISSLRFFAREGSNDPFEPTVLKTMITDTLEFCRERFKNHEIELKVDAIEESLMIECRPVQISQVLLNLLNNAHDAVESLSERWVRISVKDLGSNVEVAITDSGKGIPLEIRDKILHPFFTTKPIGRGTGLGLCVSKGIVEGHDGRIHLDTSCENTRFIVLLPKVPTTRAERLVF